MAFYFLFFYPFSSELCAKRRTAFHCGTETLLIENGQHEWYSPSSCLITLRGLLKNSALKPKGLRALEILQDLL